MSFFIEFNNEIETLNKEYKDRTKDLKDLEKKNFDQKNAIEKAKKENLEVDKQINLEESNKNLFNSQLLEEVIFISLSIFYIFNIKI